LEAKQYHIVKTMQNPNQEIVDRGKIDKPIKHISEPHLPGLVQTAM
jgi:hypothetical protein